MNPLWVVVFLGLAVVGLGLAYYGWSRYQSEQAETARLQAELEHERRMARDERDYEEVMSYAERDSRESERDDDRRR